MSSTTNTIYKQVATSLSCSYGHVRNVISMAKQGTLSKTPINKKIVRLYAEKEQEQLDILIASIVDRATNDNILQ